MTNHETDNDNILLDMGVALANMRLICVQQAASALYG